MTSSITPATNEDAFNQNTLEQLPSGTIVSMEGSKFLRIENDILRIDNNGNFESIDDITRKYVLKRVPRVIHGKLKIHLLGF